MKTWVVALSCVALLFASVTGCSWSNKMKGGTAGAVAGGAVGAAIGHAAGNTALGAILGAAVGGTAGALIGRNMDKQAEEMQADLAGAKVERVGEGIKITFDSGILFAIDSSELQPTAKTNIEALSRVLNKYPDTNVLVEGDTDATGSEEHNQKLSERRAQAVADYQKQLGVVPSRITTIGLGETNPVADNNTEEGRRLNRRVEIAIFANEKMKQAAQEGKL